MQNLALVETLQAEREEIAELVRGLEGVIGDLDGAVQELSNVVEKDDFAAEVFSTDRGMPTSSCRQTLSVYIVLPSLP